MNEELLQLLIEWVALDVMVTKMTAYEYAGDDWETCDWTEHLMSGHWDIWQKLPDYTKAKIEKHP